MVAVGNLFWTKVMKFLWKLIGFFSSRNSETVFNQGQLQSVGDRNDISR